METGPVPVDGTWLLLSRKLRRIAVLSVFVKTSSCVPKERRWRRIADSSVLRAGEHHEAYLQLPPVAPGGLSSPPELLKPQG